MGAVTAAELLTYGLFVPAVGCCQPPKGLGRMGVRGGDDTGTTERLSVPEWTIA